MNEDNSKKVYKANIRSLPDGAFISINNDPYLIAGNHIYLWTPGGYVKKQPLPDGIADVLTPKSIVNTFHAGYTIL